MKTCIACGKEVEKVNRKGYCPDCSTQRMMDAMSQIHNKSGPFYDKQLEGLKRASERRLRLVRKGKDD